MICSTCECKISDEERVDSTGDHLDLLRCLDALRAKVEALNTIECAYCGHKTLRDGVPAEDVNAAVLAHMLTCEKRPEVKLMRMLAVQASALEDAERALMGSPDGMMTGALSRVRAAIAETKQIALGHAAHVTETTCS